MNLEFTPEEQAFREEVRTFIAENHPKELADFGMREDMSREEMVAWHKILGAKGWSVPAWPVEYGGTGWTPTQRYIWSEENARVNALMPLPFGVSMVGPVIYTFGNEEQKARHLPGIRSGEVWWCQGYSEPGAGSDLASLKTTAVRDGDEYIVNGQKIWTSGAQHAKYGILIARTNIDAPKHKGVSYFICPMDLPGIEIRPIKEMTGASTFNEVFFTDVRIPVQNLVGEQDEGWRLAKVTLGNERVSLSTGGVLWGSGPTALEMLDAVRVRGSITDPVMRQRLASIYTEHILLDLIRMRTLSARLRGEQPGPEASIRKILADEHGQNVMEIARDLLGADGMLRGGVDNSERGAHNGLGGGGGEDRACCRRRVDREDAGSAALVSPGAIPGAGAIAAPRVTSALARQMPRNRALRGSVAGSCAQC